MKVAGIEIRTDGFLNRSPLLFLLPNILDADTLLTIAMATVLCYTLAWMSFVMLKFPASQWIWRWFDGDSFPDGSLFFAIGKATMQKLKRRSRRYGDVIIAERCEHESGRYRQQHRIARGDLCDVYLANDLRETYVVKYPIVDTANMLMERERDLLREVAQPINNNQYRTWVPQLVDSYRSCGRTVNVMRWKEGFWTAEEIHRRYPGGVHARHIGWMFNRTLELLGELHRCDWVHGALVPPHLLFHAAKHGLMLVDWIHSQRKGEPIRVVPSAFDRWYDKTKPNQIATTTNDIRLAARTMIWLAGGDPLTCQVPTHFPNGLGRFLHGCAQDRRHEAWAVHAQFRELLEAEFGPPEFCHFTMS